MTMRQVSLKWGPGFSNTLAFNNASDYIAHTPMIIANTSGLFDTPDQDIIMGDTVYNSPFDVRGKLKERVFSLTLSIVWCEPYGGLAGNLRNQITEACMPGIVRVIVEHRINNGGSDTSVFQYIDARCEGYKEISPGKFDVKFTAPDPVFTVTTYAQAIGNTASDPMNTVISIPYTGTAPAEPQLSFTVTGNGGVWTYYRDITVANIGSTPLNNYPMCINLGDISALVGNDSYTGTQTGRKFWVRTGVNSATTTGYPINDIRIESQGGARKLCWVRDLSYLHTDVRLWTVIYSLQPGESKIIRVIYGNRLATAESEVNTAPIRPMFNMFTSNNTHWEFGDFLPVWTQPQSRLFQWQAYAPDRLNMDWIKYAHPHFDNSTGNVPCAGGKVQYYQSASGAAGVQVNVPVPIARIRYGWRMSTAARAPLVLRLWKQDGRVDDVWAVPNPTYPLDKAALLTTNASTAAGNNQIHVPTLSRGSSTFVPGDSIFVVLDDNSTFRSTISSITGTAPNYSLNMAANIPGGRSAPNGTSVQQGETNSEDFTYVGQEQPIAAAFILRGDMPQFTSGQWYYGGAEYCWLDFESSVAPSTTAWGSATEVVLTTTGFQIKGRFGNRAYNEYISINTICLTKSSGGHLGDTLVIDCAARTCKLLQFFTTFTLSSASAGNSTLHISAADLFPAGTEMWVKLADGSQFVTKVTLRTFDSGTTGAGTINLKDALPSLAGTSSDVGLVFNRFEALSFEEIRQYWVHLDPGQNNHALVFAPDDNGQHSLTNLAISITYPTRNY